MADVQLADAGQGGDGADVVVVECVAGVETHVRAHDVFACVGNLVEFGEQLVAGHIAACAGEGSGVGAGVDFADVEASRGRGLDLTGIGIDESRDNQARVVQRLDDGFEAVGLTGDIEAALGRDLAATFGHKHGGVGLDAAGDTDHLVGRGHFEVELDADELAEQEQVAVVDVAAVFAEVDGDAVGTAKLGLVGGADRIGLALSEAFALVPRLADGGDVVDVDAELDHVGLYHARKSLARRRGEEGPRTARMKADSERSSRGSCAPSIIAPVRFLLNTIGTAGDVHPFIGVGLALKRRGHEVAVLANPHFAERIGRVGLGFWPLGTEGQYAEMVGGAELVHQTRGPSYVLRTLVLPAMGPTLEAMANIAQAWRPDAVLAHHICLAMPEACARLRIPCATAVLAPLFWLSRHEPIVYPTRPLEDLPWWGDRLMRAAMKPAARLVIDRPINAERRRLGLGRVRDAAFTEALGVTRMRGGRKRASEPRATLALWSPHYRPTLADDPKHGRICGFSWFDRAAPMDGDAEVTLKGFLDGGGPPVIFTLGTSVVHHGRDFYEVAAAACAKLNKRALLLVGAGVRKSWPAHCLALDYAPFSRVLPRGCCTVHHGGIGTTAQAMRAGTPMVIVPFANDEFDNGSRARRLGISVTLRRGKLSVATLAAAIDRVCTETSIVGLAAVMGKKLLADDGAEVAADHLEKLAALARVERVRGRADITSGASSRSRGLSRAPSRPA